MATSTGAMSKIFGALGFGNGAVQAPQSPGQQIAAQGQPAIPGNIPTQNNMPASATNPTVPAASVETMQKTEQEKPKGLDQYTDMWAPAKDGEGPKQYSSAFEKVTPESLQTHAATKDFSKVITPEMMTKISAGGEEAAAAMMQAMNTVSQAAYAESTASTMSLIDAALAKQREQFTEALPGMLKQQNLSENLRNTNPIFNHPAAAPMLEIFKNQIALKYPNATVAEQAKMANDYLIDFSNAANPPKPSESEKKKAEENKTDWSDFFDVPNN